MMIRFKSGFVAFVGAVLVAAGCRDDSPPLTHPARAKVGTAATSKRETNPAHVSKREPIPPTPPDSQPAAEKAVAQSEAKKADGFPDGSVTATATGEMIAELTMPKVVLSDAHAKVCRIKVGDVVPTLTLTDAQGKPAPLAAHYGTNFTVVAFVRLADPYAVELLDDFERFVVPVFEPRGVKVVAVAIGTAPDALAADVKKKNIRVKLLSDAEGRTLEQLTTDPGRNGPWTYLIEPSGRVVWFDMESSRSTRRDLQVALTVLTKSTRQARK